VLDDADLKVRTKYISTRNAKREMNFFAIFFYFRNFIKKLPYFHGEDSRKAVIFLIKDWIYFSCCSKRASIFLYVRVKNLSQHKNYVQPFQHPKRSQRVPQPFGC
jgi:hypothetical protein